MNSEEDIRRAVSVSRESKCIRSIKNDMRLKGRLFIWPLIPTLGRLGFA